MRDGSAAPKSGVVAFTAVVAAATGVALFLSRGHPLAAGAPLLVAGGVLLLRALPLRFVAAGLLFTLLVAEAAETVAIEPGGGAWSYPLAWLGRLYYQKLDRLTGLGALKFTLVDLLVVLLALRAALRLMARGGGARGDEVPVARCLAAAAALSFAAVLAAEARGLLAGGELRFSTYQVRQLAYLPLLVLFLSTALRGPRDHALLGGTLIGAAAVKAALSLYAYLTVFLPAGAEPQFITAHSDSVLYAVCLATLVAWGAERPPVGGRWALLLGVGALIAAGAIVNGRRIVWVELAGALAAILPFLGARRAKRAAARAAVLAGPVIALYVAAGWGSTAPVFEPVQSLRGVVDGGVDHSTLYREVENYNLVFTLRQNPVFGSGFGRPYVEVATYADLTAIFPLWRYIPHNSILGLLAFAGLAGFAAIWMPLVVAVFLDVRSLRARGPPIARAGALGSIAAIVAYAIQAYGDMGLNNTECALILAVALAVAGKVATGIGEWPMRETGPIVASPDGGAPSVAST